LCVAGNLKIWKNGQRWKAGVLFRKHLSARFCPSAHPFVQRSDPLFPLPSKRRVAMPTVSVHKDALLEALGQTYTDDEFDVLCFEFGIELDEITTAAAQAAKQGRTIDDDDAVIYKIDVPANRYDLLCIEGLVRALLIFLGKRTAPVYTYDNDNNESEPLVLTVHKSHTDTIRPYCVAAVLRNVTLTPASYQSLMDLQDQLHRNLCRQRTLVAMGTHDLDTIQGPFVYDALPANEIQFVPLTPNDQGSMSASAILEYYQTNPTAKHLKPYVSIVQDSPLLPVVKDANDTVLSLPPLINSDHSKITLNTRNIFIECTATDLTKANIVLDTLCCMMGEYTAVPYTVQRVRIDYVDKTNPADVVNSYTTPQLYTRTASCTLSECRSILGLPQLSGDDMVQLASKMQLGPACIDGDDLIVTVPPTRSDILHAVDIVEDVGIAYGFNKLSKQLTQTTTVGGEDPINHWTDLLRMEVARAGYMEMLTHGLCSIEDIVNLGLPDPLPMAVTLSNPANVEYQMVRTHLLPGLLKTISHNKYRKSLKIFEISDVVFQNPVIDTGAQNSRRLAATVTNETGQFEVVHGLLDRIMMVCQVGVENCDPNETADVLHAQSLARMGWTYSIAGMSDEKSPEYGMYLPGRAAHVYLNTPTQQNVIIGSLGVLHPDVLQKYEILYPTAVVEINIEILLETK